MVMYREEPLAPYSLIMTPTVSQHVSPPSAGEQLHSGSQRSDSELRQPMRLLHSGQGQGLHAVAVCAGRHRDVQCPQRPLGGVTPHTLYPTPCCIGNVIQPSTKTVDVLSPSLVANLCNEAQNCQKCLSVAC